MVLHRQIGAIIQESKFKTVELDKDFERYVDCINSVRHPGESAGLMRLFPKFTKGFVEISRHPSLKVEFEWLSAGDNKVRFPDLVRQADLLFAKLKPHKGSQVYLFIDELELKLGSKKTI